ncbi:MAG TPA: ATP-binding protein [Caldithrix sp.]|nr:ATP-binding protein [Caldithrix sp.]
MNKTEKDQIKMKLTDYCERYGSQNKAAESLKGVSAATISQVMNNNWELIKDTMWRNIGAQIGWNAATWNSVETRAIARMTHILTDAQAFSNVYAVCADAGAGKTKAMEYYRDNNSNAYHLCCNEYWNRKLFLQELLQQMGRNSSGFTVGEMMEEVVRTLKQRESPIIMLDEADKLSDQVLYFFITLYNQLEDHCGIVMAATDHLEKRIKKGLRLNKKGYNEIYSRLGRKFVPLQKVNSADVSAICIANGITEKTDINEVVKEARENEFDLRRVKRKIHAIKKKR